MSDGPSEHTTTLCCLESVFVVFVQINDEYSSLVVAQLLYLQSEDPKMPIHMYINSPGETLTVTVCVCVCVCVCVILNCYT